MKKTLTLMLLLGALSHSPAFSADQTISWSQDDLAGSLPVDWNTTDNIIITATTALDFSGLTIAPGSHSLINAGGHVDNAVYDGGLTFTSTGRQNYQFSNIPQLQGSLIDMIICGCNISFTEIGNLEFIGGADSMQAINARDTSLTFSNTGDISFSNFTSDRVGGAIYAWSRVDTNGAKFSHTGNISFITNISTQGGGAIISNNIEFDQINGNILFQDNHSLSNPGGAINANAGAEGKISFSNVTGSVIFTENTAGGYQGGAIATDKGVSFDNIQGDILFSDNYAKGNGGAISAWSGGNSNGVQFSSTSNISFITNISEAWGGAIVSNNVAFDQVNGNILFHDNHAIGDAGGAIAAFDGAAGEVSFSNVTGSVVFTENTAGAYQGGAIGTNKNVTFNNIQGGVLFSDNHAVSDGGGLSAYNGNNPVTVAFTNIGTGIEFSNNESGANGGAITTNNLVFSNVTGNIVFSGNRTASTGGAIYAQNGLIIDGVNGDIAFLNNHAGYDGGAIYLALGSESTIKATGGNVLFSGNTCEENGIYVPNAISMSSNTTLNLIAEEGRTITFHDPVTGGANVQINLNGDGIQSTGGTIVFSGKSANPANLPMGEHELESEYQERSRHARAYYAQYITQYGGTVSLEDSAVLEANLLYLTNDALLKLGENTIVMVDHLAREGASRISISKGASLTINNGDVDLTQGIDVNVASFLSGESSSSTFTLLNGGKLNLGGLVNFVDESGATYLNSSALSKDTSFAIMNDANSSRGDTDFEGITQSQPETYGYQGMWNLAWENDTLFANWKSSGYTASPEQIGTSGVNSLWSSASNLQSFADTSLDQTTRYRLISPQKSNYWLSGLGDFSTQRTVRGINGYDYQGGGYAVGGDHKVTDDTLVGLGFGQIFGKNQSRSYYSSIDQKSIMGMIYAAKRIELNKTNALRLHLSAAYGTTDNKMTTRYAQGGTSHGNWDNQSYGINARAIWDISLKNDWTLSPFVGLEYVSVTQDDFTEGGDMARSIKGGRLANLSLPVGVSLEKLISLKNGMKWENTATLAYRGDLYRENPESCSALASDPLTAKWVSKGSKPARNAVEASVLSRLHFNDTWNVYAGYSIEGRSNAVDQTGSIGVGMTF